MVGRVSVPIIPNASKEEFGLDISGIWSRWTEDTELSPYLTLIGCGGRCCCCCCCGCCGGGGFCWLLVASGWIMRPSTAAQIRSLRARPGILSDFCRKRNLS